MKHSVVQLLVIVLVADMCNSREGPRIISSKVGDPLYLTPLIDKKDLDKARNLSAVTGFIDDGVPSYSGYLTVNKTYRSNLFFWYFPAQKAEKAPLILWLSGGPGATSMFAVFVQNGPYYINENGRLRFRQHTWTANYSMLYVDQPVGTGFSFTNHEKGYARNQTDVTRDLYNALVQFLTLFPEEQSSDIYIAGDSYAGKYVPNIAHKIFTEAKRSPVKIKLKALMIGNGLTDPVSNLRYGDFLYYLGLLDEKTRDHFKEREKVAENLINKQEFTKALKVIDELVPGDLSPYSTAFENVTGLTRSIINFMRDSTPEYWKYFVSYVNSAHSRKALHVGSTRLLSWNRKVFEEMEGDIMHSAKPLVEEILQRGTRVLYFHGLMDILIPYAGAQTFYRSLKWDGAQEYLKDQRQIWKVGGRVAGFVRESRNFVEVAVRNAGHLVLCDQPLRALDLVNKFISGVHIGEL